MPTTPPARRRAHAPAVLAVLLVALAVVLPGVVRADSAVGIRASTLGLGAELVVGGPHLQGRLVVSGWDESLDDNLEAAGIEYDADLELRSLAALADFHPGGGAFRLTAGVAWNDHAIVGTAPVTDFLHDAGIEIDFVPGFDPGDVRATAEPDSLGPWLGLGWGSASGDGGVGVTVDLGVVYLGDYDVDFALDSDLPIDQIPGGAALLDQLLAEEAAELEAEIEEEDVDLFPIFAIGLVFRF